MTDAERMQITRKYWKIQERANRREFLSYVAFTVWFFIIHPLMTWGVASLFGRDAAMHFYGWTLLALAVARIVWIRLICGEGAQL